MWFYLMMSSLTLKLYLTRELVAFCYVACAANTGFYGFICWLSLLY